MKMVRFFKTLTVLLISMSSPYAIGVPENTEKGLASALEYRIDGVHAHKRQLKR